MTPDTIPSAPLRRSELTPARDLRDLSAYMLSLKPRLPACYPQSRNLVELMVCSSDPSYPNDLPIGIVFYWICSTF